MRVSLCYITACPGGIVLAGYPPCHTFKVTAYATLGVGESKHYIIDSGVSLLLSWLGML